MDPLDPDPNELFLRIRNPAGQYICWVVYFFLFVLNIIAVVAVGQLQLIKNLLKSDHLKFYLETVFLGFCREEEVL